MIEPYSGTPAIRRVRPLALSGADEQGFAAPGCEVQLADRTDTLLSSADPAVARTGRGAIRFAGRFGFYREQDGVPGGDVAGRRNPAGQGPASASRWTARSTGPRSSPSTAQTETITVAPAPPDVAAMVGADVFITNSDRRIAYKVLEAKAAAGGAELRLELATRGSASAGATGAADGRVQTDTRSRSSGFATTTAPG